MKSINFMKSMTNYYGKYTSSSKPHSGHFRSALALTLALTSLSGWAQSSVTVYGLLDMGFVRESGGIHGANVNKISGGVSAGSRLGFKGSEDLGSGVSAFFQLEMGLLSDTGALAQGGLGFGRQSVVGLQTPRGSIALGRQYTPVAMIQVETDPFVTGMAGDSANLISAGGAGGNNRMDNTVRYSYSAKSGWVADLVYGFGETAGNAHFNRQYGGALGYVSGPAYIKLGYHSVESATGVKGHLSFLGAKYDFGMASAHFNYVVNKGSAVFGLLNPDSRDLMLGVSIPYGSGKFLASYIRKDDKTAANYDANQIAIGYIHHLSKRTSLYTAIARIHNHALAGNKQGFYRVGNATEQGSGSRAFNLGIRHAF